MTSYKALVGLAEYFRTCQPPKIRECIHCLQASLNIGLPAILDARVRLNIGKLLLLQTNNVGHARSHLQQAVRIALPPSVSSLQLIRCVFIPLIYSMRWPLRLSYAHPYKIAQFVSFSIFFTSSVHDHVRSHQYSCEYMCGQQHNSIILAS